MRFRIYQELLNNIVKHAQASQVCIQLIRRKSEVVFDVQDNGTGFTVTTDWLELAQRGHLGLVGVRERAEAVGGKVHIQCSPNEGTRVQVAMPLDETND